MRDLYERLAANGLEANFVREVVLPDWWDDKMADVPANRAIAEMAVARHFGFRIADLRDRGRALKLPTADHVRLKRARKVSSKDVAGAVAVAERAAALTAELLTDYPGYAGAKSAQVVRNDVLRRGGSAFVDLRSLLDFCWNLGIAVVHLTRCPVKSRKIDGLAVFSGARPVIVLASGRDSPPWLAYHLAHELGHILCGHISEGRELLVDEDLDKKDEDRQEIEADEFACEVLTGQTCLAFEPTYGLTAAKLSRAAWEYGEQHRISPGTVVLIYGRSANRWPAAQQALVYQSQNSGAAQLLAQAYRAHVPLDDLPESTRRFLASSTRAFS